MEQEMVTEVFVFKINPAAAEKFEKVYAEIVPILRKQKGYHSDRLMRAIERPEEYILAVEWDNVEAHQAFIDSDSYPEMDQPFGGFVEEGILAYYITVASN